MTAQIREAVIDDAEPLAQLMTELGYPTAAPAMRIRLGRFLSDAQHVTLVAEANGDVVGVAGGSLDWYLEKDGRYARLVALVVSPRLRRQGVGRALLDAIEQWSAGHGAREVVVNSGLHRRDAHEFYERSGYARTGVRFVKPIDEGRAC